MTSLLAETIRGYDDPLAPRPYLLTSDSCTAFLVGQHLRRIGAIRPVSATAGRGTGRTRINGTTVYQVNYGTTTLKVTRQRSAL